MLLCILAGMLAQRRFITRNVQNIVDNLKRNAQVFAVFARLRKQIFSRPGEGLFGFTYRLTGKADNPQVSVNPLSILTPGMFREIFRRPAPKLESGG